MLITIIIIGVLLTIVSGFSWYCNLIDGTVTVSTASVKTGYKIYVSHNAPSGVIGILSASTADIINETSFVINSTNAGDNSTVNWWIAP